jgi:hypothetical protein
MRDEFQNFQSYGDAPAGRTGPAPRESVTEQFPLFDGPPSGPSPKTGPPSGPMPQVGPGTRPGTPPTGYPGHPSRILPSVGRPSPLESTQAHPYDPFADDDSGVRDLDGFPGRRGGDEQDDFGRPNTRSGPSDYDRRDRRDVDDDLDRDDRDDRDDLDDRDDYDRRPATPAREWLMIAAQIGIGAVGGAAVWLGFSWLWELLPAAAMIAAVVVVVGLVLVVRKLRRADDLQTTILAILAGLVVTVSPAALLLLKR